MHETKESMNYPKITIITPTYNQSGFIQETIDSVINQNYPNLEYIVIDGGSTDDTLDILKHNSSQIKWFSEKDRGQTNAINKGLKLATGDIIAYLNSDDILLPGAFETVAEYFQKHPTCQWVTGYAHIIDENGHKTRSQISLYKNIWLQIRSLSTLLITNYISQPSTFWRKSLQDEIGEFNESLKFVMDYDYWIRMASRYPLGLIRKPLSCFRTHPSSKMRSKEQLGSDEEAIMISQYTRSRVLQAFHRIHRNLTNSVYSLITKPGPQPENDHNSSVQQGEK
jgi:glycosyltransferase involved in cell wall biosynthesis